MKKLKKLIPLAVFLMIAILFRFVFLIGFVPSESMEPTLMAGSFFVAFRFFHEIQVSDIIVFRHEGKVLVKRVAAIGGDELILNGESLIVPDGKLIVLGDNSENSYDSRYWDAPFIDERDVVAKVIGK